MKTNEHVVLNIDTYDDFKAQDEVYKKSIEQCEEEIKNLKDREVVAQIKITKRNYFGQPLESFLQIKSDSKLIQASFDELKEIHSVGYREGMTGLKEEIDNLMNRSFWQRIRNVKL